MSPRDILLALTVAFVWGISFIAIRWGVDEVSPLLLTALRYIFAALPAAADEAAYDLGRADLTEALAGESLPELPEDTYSAAHTALTAAHAAYEAKFGHVFVIHLDGTPPEERLDRVLEGIYSRLKNDPEDERVMSAEQLRRLAHGRLRDLLRGAGPCPSAAPPGGTNNPHGAAPGR